VCASCAQVVCLQSKSKLLIIIIIIIVVVVVIVHALQFDVIM